MSQAYKGEMILSHEGAQFGYGASVILLPQRNFGLVLLGNNMNGINAAANVLAYHLIDEELGIPLESRFDWIARYVRTLSWVLVDKLTSLSFLFGIVIVIVT